MLNFPIIVFAILALFTNASFQTNQNETQKTGIYCNDKFPCSSDLQTCFQNECICELGFIWISGGNCTLQNCTSDSDCHALSPYTECLANSCSCNFAISSLDDTTQTCSWNWYDNTVKLIVEYCPKLILIVLLLMGAVYFCFPDEQSWFWTQHTVLVELPSQVTVNVDDRGSYGALNVNQDHGSSFEQMLEHYDE